MIRADKADHHHRKQKGNADGGNGVRIEHLQQFNIRGNHRNQVTLVLALQFGRAQPAQRSKHLIPNQCQQLKRNKMVAGLLCIAQTAPHQGKHRHRPENSRCGSSLENGHNGKAAKHRNKRGAQVSHKPHGDCKNHIAAQGSYQTDELFHHLKSASLHSSSPPFA